MGEKIDAVWQGAADEARQMVTHFAASRRRRAWIVVVLAAALLAVGCSSIKVRTDYDPEVDFTKMKTWGWAPEPTPTGDVVVDTDDLFKSRVRRAVETQLAAKGYRYRGEGADFHLGFFLVVEDKVKVTSVNNHYGYGPGWGWGYGYPAGSTHTTVDNYQEGTLIIDISREPQHTLAWRGTGTTRLSKKERTPEQTTAIINDAVTKILAGFPPGATK